MSDHGILWAVALDGKGGRRALEWEELSAAPPQAVWLHLTGASPELRAWLHDHSGLDDAALETFLSPETRPRCMADGETLLVFVRGVNLNPGSQPDDMLSLRMAVSPQLLITFRQARLATPAAVAERLEAGQGPADIPSLFVTLVVELSGRIQPVLDNLDDLIAEREGELESTQRKDLTELRRQTIALRRYLAPQRAALASLVAAAPAWLPALGLARLREVADVTARFVEHLDEIRERGSVLHDELSNRVGEELNARMYALSVVTLVFLPLGLLTGLLGINVGGMPGSDDPQAFWIVCGILLAISALIGVWLRRLRWI